MSLQEALRRERAEVVNPLTPWYKDRRQAVPPTAPFGVMTRLIVTPPLRSAIAKRNETFSAPKKKRPKDYSSDSSASAKSTADGKTEGRIYRMPSGSAKDYYVYCACPTTTTICLNTKLTTPVLPLREGKESHVWRLVNGQPQQQRRRARQLYGSALV